MTYDKVRKDPELKNYDRELLNHLSEKGIAMLIHVYIVTLGNLCK